MNDMTNLEPFLLSKCADFFIVFQFVVDTVKNHEGEVAISKVFAYRFYKGRPVL